MALSLVSFTSFWIFYAMVWFLDDIGRKNIFHHNMLDILQRYRMVFVLCESDEYWLRYGQK
jgi:hypothetical protein